MSELRPDWFYSGWTSEKMESEFTDFKFKGPGLYHSQGTSLLVVPCHRNAILSTVDENPLHKSVQFWAHDPDRVERFDVFYWSCGFPKNLMTMLSYVPVLQENAERAKA